MGESGDRHGGMQEGGGDAALANDVADIKGRLLDLEQRVGDREK